MGSEKKTWQDTGRWLRVGALSVSAISPFINILLARLRANVEAEQALLQQEKDENAGVVQLAPQEINLDVQERVQAMRATLDDLLLEIRKRPYSQRLLQQGEELRERSNQLSQAVAERSSQISQAVAERSSQLSQTVADRSSRLTQDLADRGSRLTQNLTERSSELSQDLARRGRRARTQLAARDRNFWILLGFGTGLVAAAVATFLLIRRRLQQTLEEEPPIQITYDNTTEAPLSSQPRGNIYSVSANGTKLEAQSTGTAAAATPDASEVNPTAGAVVETTVPSVPAEETSETIKPVSLTGQTTSPAAETSHITSPADAAFVGVSSTKRYYPVETPLDQLHEANGGAATDVVYFSSEDEARGQGFSAAAF